MVNSKIIGYLCAVLATVLLGSLGIFVRNISVNGYIITFARVGVGFAFLALYILFQNKYKEIKFSDCSWTIVFSGALLATTSLCYINAVNSTTLANAVFLLYTGPLVAVGLTAIILKERFSLINGVLIAVAFAGFLCLLEFNFDLNPNDAIGYLWGLGAGLCYALYIVFNRRIPDSMSGLIRSFYQLFFATLTILPFLNESLFQISPKDMLWLLALGISHGSVAFSLIVIAVKHLKAVEFGTISYVEPLVATCIGFVLFAEQLSLLQITGCVIIFSGGLIQVFNPFKQN